jgi:hypothetical protein
LLTYREINNYANPEVKQDPTFVRKSWGYADFTQAAYREWAKKYAQVIPRPLNSC